MSMVIHSLSNHEYMTAQDPHLYWCHCTPDLRRNKEYCSVSKIWVRRSTQSSISWRAFACQPYLFHIEQASACCLMCKDARRLAASSIPCTKLFGFLPSALILIRWRQVGSLALLCAIYSSWTSLWTFYPRRYILERFNSLPDLLWRRFCWV